MNKQGIDAKSMFRFLDLDMKGYLDADSLEKSLK